jgi:16S rRNA processing protein RimM
VISGSEDPILVGRIGRAHGLDGTVVVDLETDDADTRFAPGAVVRLADGRELTVTRYRLTERSPLVSFAEVTHRSAAESLRGAELLIRPEERRPLGPDEYWPEDLIGLRVVDRDGIEIGVVRDVESEQPQDRLHVQDPDGTIHIVPLVAALVRRVDLGAGTITVELPPGLID